LPVYRQGGKGSVLRRMSFTGLLRYNPGEANLGQSLAVMRVLLDLALFLYPARAVMPAL
jgi:hypothetical protein